MTFWTACTQTGLNIWSTQDTEQSSKYFVLRLLQSMMLLFTLIAWRLAVYRSAVSRLNMHTMTKAPCPAVHTFIHPIRCVHFRR